MFPENGNIVAGVSGGPDSVCLLLVLCELRENCDLHLTAVHVHHGLRQEAGEDARFVEELCRTAGCALQSGSCECGGSGQRTENF